jgi:cytochrome c oxidase subunit 3
MPLFIVAEALFFAGFLVAYWVLRLTAKSWPPAGTPHLEYVIPVIMTIILIASSVTIHFAERCLEKEVADKNGFHTWLIVTLILGAVFVALSVYEWSALISAGFGASTNVYSTAFYSITGLHASHVIVGLGLFISILLPSLNGKVSAPLVKSASIYWHFVDIVWLFVVSQVYFW